MNTIRLGLFQESTDRFAFALHSDTAPERSYQAFSARDLRATFSERLEGGTSVQRVPVPAVPIAFSFYPLSVMFAVSPE